MSAWGRPQRADPKLFYEPTRHPLDKDLNGRRKAPPMRDFSTNTASRCGGDKPRRLRALWSGSLDFARRVWPTLKAAVAVLNWLRKLAAD